MDFFGLGSRRSSRFDTLAEESGEEREVTDEVYGGRYGREIGQQPQENRVERDEEEDEEDEDDEDLDSILGPTQELEEQWKPVVVRNARPPHPLTITHVNQTHDLQRLSDVEAAVNAETQDSEEWLRTHSVEHLKLQLQDLIDKGRISKLSPDRQTGKVDQHIQFESYDVNEFEYRLNLAIETYTKRIKWLLQGSKRMFGLVKGKKVAVCVDAADANMGFGRQTALQESLLHLLDEQLSHKAGLYLMAFGTDIDPLWPVVRDVNCRVVDEGKEWISRLKPMGGCNLLKAMKQVMRLPDIDSIILILGSVPDQTPEILCDYVYQMGVGRRIPLHAISYDCSNHLTNMTLRKLAEASHGRFHCYAASCEEQIYTGTDISMLLKEIRATQDIINKIKEMREGLLGSAIISIMNEISSEVAKLPQSRFLPRPPGHELPLRIEFSKFQPRSSSDWLRQHGLKAKRLDLYQILAPNAYSYKEEFIPVIKKAVQSQVHERAMVQFGWHDGTVKNVHVDMTQLFEYQKQLGEAVGVLEKRIDWLASGSRRIFSSVVERNVVLLVDVSVSNVNYLVHIQHSLRLLMEQQIANKDYFNVIVFGSKAVAWKPTMMRPTPENLQEAWRWVLDLQCGGSRNFLAAFRLAVENEEEIKHGIFVQGMYLFTSGVPDQHPDVACDFIQAACCGRGIKLHSILFNVDDYDANGAIPSRYANISRTAECLRNMAHITNGRFHWFRETGIIESDDIQCVNAEIDKALNYSRKVVQLINSVKKKYRERYHHIHVEEIKSRPQLECRNLSHRALLPPRPSSAKTGGQERLTDRPRAITWRPSSASVSRENKPPTAPTTGAAKSRPLSAKDPMQKVRGRKVKKDHFFLEDKKHESGSVVSDFPSQTSVRKGILQVTIPDAEDCVTSKEWLRRYGLSKLKLDLNRLVSGPDCRHVDKRVKALKKDVSAKYCDIFPKVNVKGTMKHLQLLPHELGEYEGQVEKVLKRYLKRLQWMLSGSRRVFGTVVHTKCVFLVDTSGSMSPYMPELKRELASLIWEQLYRMGASFNLIRFSGSCEQWQSYIQPATEENCHSAIKWASNLQASGNTCTLEALQMAFSDPNIEAVYLLTDGKPDTSTALVLKEVVNMNSERSIPVNTISFNCSDSTANNFLRLLAQETGGRYHRCHSDFDAQLFAHKLLSEGFKDTEYPHLPQFEGDDLRILGIEITLARRFIQQSRTYRALYKSKSSEADNKEGNDQVTPAPFLIGRPRSINAAR